MSHLPEVEAKVEVIVFDISIFSKSIFFLNSFDWSSVFSFLRHFLFLSFSPFVLSSDWSSVVYFYKILLSEMEK